MASSRRSGAAIAALVLVGATACEAPTLGPDAAPIDAPPACAADRDCDDGVFCNGEEQCVPAGCVAGEAPCASDETCDETGDRCVAPCPDADGDGADDAACGGTDCDDSDPLRHPAATEVCDAAGADEDCDPDSFGARDADGDGHVDAACCNGAGTAGEACGDDCDDARPASYAGATEACNTFDDDCDGSTDEGVLRSFHPDADMDGFGAIGSTPLLACVPPALYVESATDCDDTRASTSPGAAELCEDGVDNDCDGTTDETGMRTFFRDEDGDTYGDPDRTMATLSCAPPPGYVTRAGDCNDRDAAYHPTAPDPCDGRDTDCSLPDPGAGGPDPGEDGDGDMHAPPSAACTSGYPRDDCDDAAPTVHPGASELCDGRDTVCASGGGARASEDADGDRHAGTTAACSGGPFPRDDCDDASPAVHPGAPEICDGRDDRCLAGGGPLPAEDGDGDLHSATGALCSGGPYPRDDCDDADATVHPGATELCNRRDDVCASGGLARAEEDADSDGHAPIAAACTGGPLPRDDCDDASASIRPGAIEVCDGAIDHDCDGAIDDAVDAGAWCGPGRGCDPGGVCTGPTIATGAATSCAIASGEVWCWGGQPLGDGTRERRPSPVRALGITDAVEIASSLDAVCARRRGGTITCWGYNGHGQIGNGTTTSPDAPVPAATGIDDAIALDVSSAACAVRRSGALWCWGTNADGQVGDGTTIDRLAPVQVIASGIAQVALGSAHGCARQRSGGVLCWGDNSQGQLGIGTTVDSRTPVAVPGITDAVEIASASSTTCARRATGRVMCWGANGDGQIGDGITGAARLSPAMVDTTETFDRLAAGSATFYARTATGAGRAWGDNAEGRIGDGTTLDRATPVAIAGLASIAELSASQHACARTGSGAVLCWGRNAEGQIGDGNGPGIPRATVVAGIGDAVEVGCGADHTCARSSDGAVRCWGADYAGQLGDGLPLVARGSPGIVPGLTATALAVGAFHACALTASGVSCWGDNGRGETGSGAFSGNRPSPVAAIGTGLATAIAAGTSASYARLSDGRILAWGRNDYGQVNPALSDFHTPTAVPGIADASGVGAGEHHACAVRPSGLSCFGRNQSGQLGDGTLVDQRSPVAAIGTAGATAFEGGSAHSCMLTASGISCWGDGFYGQLGDGTRTSRPAPTMVPGLLGPSAIDLGPFHSCAVTSTGIQCFGWNFRQQLAREATDILPSPQPVAGTAAATGVCAGHYHACALHADGRVSCWGYDESGQIGRGIIGVDRATPTAVIGLP